ncbi:hypothetical protein A9Q99_26645 [Gammaproteobacteria bacterium 45_16_T64]|nr:hypothetical protein A9Q99_26645 [Gammaproteobacteria bacterium 45_16_T64]
MKASHLSLYETTGGTPSAPTILPAVPKGGSLVLPGFGTFDTLNPYLLKGISPINSSGMGMYGFSELNEPLMVGTGGYLPSGNEIQTAYCLICSTIEYTKDLSSIRFNIRTDAKFHDGSSITAMDVEHSLTLLRSDLAHPRYADVYRNVTEVQVIDPHSIRFSLSGENRKSLMLRLGELPVMSKTHWTTHSFDDASTTPPMLSGPYQVGKFTLGSFIEFTLKKDHWAKDHPLYQGQFNFNTVRMDFFKDQTIAFEAFKAGVVDVYYEYTSKNWATAYDFPAIQQGKITKEEITHQIPSGTQAFFFNLRKTKFSDIRVRKALSLLFDFEWTNKTLFSNAYKRSNTYYPNSPFEATGLPAPEELSILLPLKDSLPEELFEKPFTSPITKANGNIRTQLRHAISLLKQAGWVLSNQKLVHELTREPFEIEFLINQPGFTRVINPFIKNLTKAGITATARVIDRSQYKVRLDEKDFDVITFVYPQTLSPNYEQRLYFHSSQANLRGSRNFAGIENPTIDALIDNLLSAIDRPSLTAATKSLDRALLWSYYTIPHWHLNYHRIAYWNKLHKPNDQPNYTLGFTRWWHSPTP